MEYHIQFNYEASRDIYVEADSPEEALELAREKEHLEDYSYENFKGGLVFEEDDVVGNINEEYEYESD